MREPDTFLRLASGLGLLLIPVWQVILHRRLALRSEIPEAVRRLRFWNNLTLAATVGLGIVYAQAMNHAGSARGLLIVVPAAFATLLLWSAFTLQSRRMLGE